METFQTYLDGISKASDMEQANELLNKAQEDSALTDVQLRHINQAWLSAISRIGNANCEVGMGGG